MLTTEPVPDETDLTLAPEAPLVETLQWALRHAAMAPSELNSQPWSFLLELLPPDGARLQLRLDPTRALPHVDPDGREGVLACGAALLNLCLALHGSGAATQVRRQSWPDQPDLLAEVDLVGTVTETTAERELRLAIPARRTHRGSFDPGEVADDVATGARPVPVATLVRS